MQEYSLSNIIDKSVRDIRSCSWVQDEFQGAEFGDRRLFLRFLVVAEHLARQPQAPVNQASQGWSKTKAAYRFFDNDRVQAGIILHPHITQTRKRIRNQTAPVFLIQDTTFLNYSHMSCVDDLGPIGQLAKNCMGLVMHTSLAVSIHGLPLGIVDQRIWARDKDQHGKTAQRKHRALADKESYRWIQALRRYHTLLPRSPMMVTICDREGDIYDLFLEAERLQAKFLIRAKYNRSLGHERLWRFMQQQTVATTYTVTVPEGEQNPRREAFLEVRYAPIPLRYPSDRPRAKKLPDIPAYAVYIQELHAPPSVEPLEWMLVTNVAVASPKHALERIAWYMLRWHIEIFHRILKSGCKVEYARFEKNHRRIAYLTLKSVIAWKLLLLTHFHRISPTQPALTLMSPIECTALYAAIHDKFPKEISFTARQAIRWLGQLGGFLARKSDKEPGPTAVWRGWQRLQDFTKMLHIASP